MISALEHINKHFENKTRLGIMSALMVNDRIDFVTLKELLNATDGNLASHLRALEELAYLKVEKQFIERKSNTSYSVTVSGYKAFSDHLSALEDLIKGVS
ncbi:MAG: transcriptional regulator [Bacteroidales bacterium]|jgi:DNA-binding MarR family transcriptional regulator|nr:transcriptional regulator [Bacteroidales bacterium]